MPSNYDQNQVNIFSHSNNNHRSHNPENTKVLVTHNQNPNSVVNGYLYNPNYVFGGGTSATAAVPAREVQHQITNIPLMMLSTPFPQNIDQ